MQRLGSLVRRYALPGITAGIWVATRLTLRRR